MSGALMMYWNGVMADHARAIALKGDCRDHSDADEAVFAARLARFRGKTFLKAPVSGAQRDVHVITFNKARRVVTRSS